MESWMGIKLGYQISLMECKKDMKEILHWTIRKYI